MFNLYQDIPGYFAIIAFPVFDEYFIKWNKNLLEWLNREGTPIKASRNITHQYRE
jgi:hypothetical protein